MIYTTAVDGNRRFRAVLAEVGQCDLGLPSRLCFDYALHGDADVQLAEAEDVAEDWNGWEPVTDEVELHLHEVYLVGSRSQFRVMTRVIMELLTHDPSTGPVSHVSLLGLWDCAVDAIPDLRRLVLLPLLIQARVVAHCQWAIRYGQSQLHQMALLHLETAQKLLKKHGSPVPVVLDEGRVSTLHRVLNLFTGRAIRAEGAENAVDRACAAFMRVPDCEGALEVAKTHYLDACRREEECSVAAERLASRSLEELDSHFSPVLRSLNRAISPLSGMPAGGTSSPEVLLLRSAIHLAEARLENTKARLAERRPRHQHVCVPTARKRLDEALLELALAQDTGRAALKSCCELLDACILTEQGEWELARQRFDAIRRNASTDATTSSVAACNWSLTHALLGRHHDALSAVHDVARMKPGYRNAYFQKLMWLCDPPLTAIEAEVILQSLRSAPTFEDGLLDPTTPSIIREARALFRKGEARAGLHRLMSAGDLIRDRKNAMASLDPIVVFELIGRLDEVVCGFHGASHSPLLRDTAVTRIDPDCWARTGSTTRWACYGEVYRELTSQAEYDTQALWESAEDEYRRWGFALLKMHRYYCAGGQWDWDEHSFYTNDAQPEVTHLYGLAAGSDPGDRSPVLAAQLTLLRQGMEATSRCLQHIVSFVGGMDERNGDALGTLRNARNAREHDPVDTDPVAVRKAWLSIVPRFMTAVREDTGREPLSPHA